VVARRAVDRLRLRRLPAVAQPAAREDHDGAAGRYEPHDAHRRFAQRRLSELVAEVLTDPDRRAWFDGRVDRLAAEVAVTG
jgi:hypothetical protein